MDAGRRAAFCFSSSFKLGTRCEMEFVVFGDGFPNVELVAEARERFIARSSERAAMTAGGS